MRGGDFLTSGLNENLDPPAAKVVGGSYGVAGVTDTPLFAAP